MDDYSPQQTMRSPSAEMLTPRSKVAKMLADIDNAPTPSPPTRLMSKSVNAPYGHVDRVASSPPAGISTNAKSIASHAPAPPAKGPFQVESDTDSDDDDVAVVRRPQGRGARRMLGLQSSPRSSHSFGQQASPSPAERQPTSLDLEDEPHDLYSATPLKPRAALTAGTPMGSTVGGLFVSPARSTENVSDDELPSNPFGSKERLAELVAQKRNERLRREAEEHRRSSSPHVSSDLPEGVLGDSQEALNPEIERIMSDAARPTRKASKRALLEMERETQRLSRQQALAHQMKVKKKFTTSDLLAKFSARRSSPLKEVIGSSSAPNSDGVEVTPRKRMGTPPSSPPTAGPTPLDKQKEMVERGALSKLVPVREDSIASLAQLDSDDELPDIAVVMSSAREVVHAAVEPAAALATDTAIEKRGLKLARFGKVAFTRRDSDSSEDDDLDIVAPLPKHLQMFDKVRKHDGTAGSDNKAIHALKHLAHIGAYEGMPRGRTGKNATRPSIGSKTLEKQLRLRAKEQAKQQMEERIEELRLKGVVVQTEEERERDAEGLEDLLEKGRRDAEAIRKAEKAEAKKEGGDVADASDDESDDGDYLGSGSEMDEDLAEDGSGELIDGAAEEDGEDESDGEDIDTMNDVEEPTVEDDQEASGAETVEDLHPMTPALPARKPRQHHIIQDDSDEDSDFDPAPQDTNLLPDDAVADPFAAFNFGANASSHALMSPTQAFKATMQTPSQATQEDSFDILRRIAPPSAQSGLPPTFPPTFDEETQDEAQSQVSMVPGSQVPESQRMSLGWEIQQAPETPGPAGLTRGMSALSETPGWEPTQDAGLASPWTLGLGVRAGAQEIAEEHDTQSTVQLRISESPAAAPTASRRVKLQRRRAGALADSSDEDDEALSAASAKQQKRDAFREMARLRTAALTTAERAEANREMRQMLEEQAEESEDEYAGLGGDDFVAPETEEDKAMIDSSHIEVDERELAAHYAERRRVEDEKATSKLYKDLTTGVLRRQQANAFGLEEDEDEIAIRRRVMRQREEARKRKLLLKDENLAGLLLGKGRESKGKDAFLKAIADDDERDDEMLGLSDDENEDSQAATQEESQSQSQQATQQSQPGPEAEAPLREVSGNKRRYPDGEDKDKAEDLPPAKQRRTQAGAFKKPISLLEVRETVSFLLDEPDHGFAAPSAGDDESETDYENDSEDQQVDSEEDEEVLERARQNDGGFASNSVAFDAQAMPPPPPRLPASERRTVVKPTVVDRLSLKRGSSTSADTHSRSAWAAPLTSGAGAFKTPSLLRRATTSTVANDRGVSTPIHLAREGSSNSGVRMGGSKKSSLAYQARAEERRAIVEAGARRRDANTERIAALRRNSSALGKGLTGSFEE